MPIKVLFIVIFSIFFGLCEIVIASLADAESEFNIKLYGNSKRDVLDVVEEWIMKRDCIICLSLFLIFPFYFPLNS